MWAQGLSYEPKLSIYIYVLELENIWNRHRKQKVLVIFKEYVSILDEKFLQIQNVITLHCFLNSGTSVLLWVLFLISIFYSVILFRRGLGISYLSVFKKGGKDCSYLENNILCKALSSLMSRIWKNLEEIVKIINFHGQT